MIVLAVASWDRMFRLHLHSFYRGTTLYVLVACWAVVLDASLPIEKLTIGFETYVSSVS